MSSGRKLWQPTQEQIAKTHMHALMTGIAKRHGIKPDWEALRTWAIENSGAFWSEMLEYAGIEPSKPATSAVSGDGMLGTRWFEGMTLNYARHMLRFDDDHDAILFENETDGAACLTHRPFPTMPKREVVVEYGPLATATARVLNTDRGKQEEPKECLLEDPMH